MQGLQEASVLSPGWRPTGVVGMAEGGVMDGRGSRQHVSGVAEGGKVAHVGHVSSQAGATPKGRRPVMHAFGQLIVAISGPFAPLGLAGHLAVACLD
ncbi:hypothetical protein J4Q44_G00102420, partial [Coregonus suidteri]